MDLTTILIVGAILIIFFIALRKYKEWKFEQVATDAMKMMVGRRKKIKDAGGAYGFIMKYFEEIELYNKENGNAGYYFETKMNVNATDVKIAALMFLSELIEKENEDDAIDVDDIILNKKYERARTAYITSFSHLTDADVVLAGKEATEYMQRKLEDFTFNDDCSDEIDENDPLRILAVANMFEGEKAWGEWIVADTQTLRDLFNFTA